MKSVKRLAAVVAFTLILGLQALGDCPSPVPGETLTPPCNSSQPASDDSVASIEIPTPPDANSVDVFTISEVTVDLLLSAIF